MFIELREREKSIDVREKHQSVAEHICPDLMYPNQGSNPQPRYAA